MREDSAFRPPSGPAIRFLLDHRFGLHDGCWCRPIAVRTVAVDDLRVRRQPLPVGAGSEVVSGRRVRAARRSMTNPIERFLPVVDGKRDRRIRNTPHHELLRHYKETGERLYTHDYARLAAVRAALQGKRRSDEFLRGKVDAVCDLFESMKEHGYCGGPFRDELISVFESPIYPPGLDYEPLNFEILGGHHRAAAAAVCRQ